MTRDFSNKAINSLESSSREKKSRRLQKAAGLSFKVDPGAYAIELYRSVITTVI